MSSGMKSFGLAVAFALELAMLAAFAYWGFHTGGTTVAKVLLGVGTPVLVAAIWGVFMAPRSARRLQGMAYQVVRIILFGLAALALITAGQPVLGIVLAALFLISLRWNG